MNFKNLQHVFVERSRQDVPIHKVSMESAPPQIAWRLGELPKSGKSSRNEKSTMQRNENSSLNIIQTSKTNVENGMLDTGKVIKVTNGVCRLPLLRESVNRCNRHHTKSRKSGSKQSYGHMGMAENSWHPEHIELMRLEYSICGPCTFQFWTSLPHFLKWMRNEDKCVPETNLTNYLTIPIWKLILCWWFNTFENYQSNWIISPSRGENWKKWQKYETTF